MNANKFIFFSSIKLGEKFMHYSEKDDAYVTMIKVSESEAKPEKEFSGLNWKFNNPFALFFKAPGKS